MTTTNRKQKINQLKTECKRLAAAGSEQRKVINRTTRKERYDAWAQKRDIGQQARIHYIAYCLLRGRDYARMEQHVDDQGSIFAVTWRAKLVTDVLQKYCIEAERDFWTKEHVKAIFKDARAEVRSSGR